MNTRSKSNGREGKIQPKPIPHASPAQKQSLSKPIIPTSGLRTMTPQAQTYDTINEAVHEYLLKSGLFKTVDTFRVLL